MGNEKQWLLLVLTVGCFVTVHPTPLAGLHDPRTTTAVGIVRNGDGHILKNISVVTSYTNQGRQPIPTISARFSSNDEAIAFFTSVMERTNGLQRSLGLAWEITTGIFDFVSIIGSLTGGDSELQYLAEQFGIINTKLDDILEGVQDILSAIDMSAIQQHYAGCEEAVRGSLTLFLRIVRSTTEQDRQLWITEFRNQFLSTSLETKLVDLVSGISGNQINLPQMGPSVQQYTDYHRRHVENYFHRQLQILMIGTTLTAFYYKLAGFTLDQVKLEWDQRARTSETAALVYVQQCIDGYEPRLLEDLEYLMSHHESDSHEAFAEVLWSFFSDKYDWRAWAVLVYDPVSGFDRHTLNGNYLFKFRIGDKNAAAVGFNYAAFSTIGDIDYNAVYDVCSYDDVCNSWYDSESVYNQLQMSLYDVYFAAIQRYQGLYTVYNTLLGNRYYFQAWDAQTVIGMKVDG